MIQNFRAEIKERIDDWGTRLLELNSFLPYFPWQRGDADGLVKRVFVDAELQDILMNMLAPEHQERLDDNGYDVWDHTFDKTVSKLHTLEKRIQKDGAYAKDIKTIQKKLGLKSSVIDF